MELLFTWIEDYRNIRNQGINFSAEFDISFNNQTSTLSFSKRQNYIPLFFGENISNISVIVGENGTGKTGILNIGEATFYIGRNKNKYFLVCKDEKKIEKIKFQIDIPISIEKYIEFRFEDTLIVQYSNFIDNSIERSNNKLFPSNSLFDFSTNRLVRRIIDFQEENFEPGLLEFSSSKPIVREIQMHISEIEMQMNFLLKGDNYKKVKFRTPEILNIILNIDTELQCLIKRYNGRKESGGGDDGIKEIISCFLKKQLPKQFKKSKQNSRDWILKISDKEYTLFLLRWSMFFSFINTFTDGNGPAQWLGFDDDWVDKPIEQWFNYFFNKYIILETNYIGSKYDGQIEAWADNAVCFVEDFKELLDIDIVRFSYPKNISLFTYGSESYGVGLNLIIDISNKYYNEFLYRRLVLNYSKIQKPLFWLNVNRDFLSFSWRGVSSGEISMLRIFSRFNELIETIFHRREVKGIGYVNAQITHLLFLIDEGEVGLHPTWQKQFLNTLIENIPLMFKESGVESIQMILATHSPFILSDVPNNHVIFLEKDINGDCLVNKNPLQDKKMTFGANIHSLLSDGFFMKEGLMGDFAKKKINQLIDDLIDKGIRLSDERKTEIKSMIPLIGEPIIRKKIMDLYNEQVNLSIDDRIQSLETEIKKLKAIQNDSNK